MTPEALALLYQLRLEGMSDSTARAIIADIEVVVAEIVGWLGARTALDESFQYARYASLRTRLAAFRAVLRDKIGDDLDEGLDAALATTRAAVAQELAAARVSLGFALLPVEQMLAVKDVPHDGFTWTRWGRKLADDTLGRVESELRQALALGEPVREVAKRVEHVADLSRVSAQRLARTALTASSNRGRMAQWQSPGIRQFADGWRFSAILDGRVSVVCASLHGKIFSLDDVNAPKPPRHPNCRSAMMLVWKDGLSNRFDRGGFEALGTGEDWLRGLPTERQREILGEARFQAFQRGVSLSGIVTYDRPLTAAELRRMYPEEMAA